MSIRHKRPDRKNALSIVTAAERDMKYTLTLKQSEDSAPTIVRNIYEAFRMLGDALCVAEGIETEDHLTPISKLLELKVTTKRPINLISSLRRLRHNINYYGYLPNVAELKDAVSIAETCFEPLKQKVIEFIRQ